MSNRESIFTYNYIIKKSKILYLAAATRVEEKVIIKGTKKKFAQVHSDIHEEELIYDKTQRYPAAI